MSEETLFKAQSGRQLDKTSWSALFLIGAGFLLLVGNFLNIHFLDFLWPIFIIAPGLLLMWPAYQSSPGNRSKLAFLAVPGAMLAAFGALLGLMNLADHFESLAYAWTLILAAGAMGYRVMKRHDGQAHERSHRFVRTMVLLFMGLTAFFELIVFSSLGAFWPLLLISLGIYLWVKK
jgi:hypothetical protein